MKQKDIFNFKLINSHSFSTFTSCVTCKWNVGFLNSQLLTLNLNRNYCSFLMLQVRSYQKEKTPKTDVADKLCSVIYWNEKNASFAEINRKLLLTITKTPRRIWASDSDESWFEKLWDNQRNPDYTNRWREEFRMSGRAFEKLVNLFRGSLEKRDTHF